MKFICLRRSLATLQQESVLVGGLCALPSINKTCPAVETLSSREILYPNDRLYEYLYNFLMHNLDFSDPA